MNILTPRLPHASLSLTLAACVSAWIASPAFGQVTPALERIAINLGQQPASAPITGTVWLALHNQAALDAAVEAMYRPGSPTYHKFLSPQDMKQFAPTAAELESVKAELGAHHLSVVRADPDNYSVKFEGTTADFEAAFQTVVNRYRMKDGTAVNGLLRAPALAGGAAGLVHAVTGVAGAGMHSYLRHPVDPITGKQIGRVALASAQTPQGLFFSPHCFYLPQTINMAAAGATLPRATYSGIAYGAPPSNTANGTLTPCGYSPQDIYQIYGLLTAFHQGYTGAGQTIAVVDAGGSPTIDSDLATFNTTYGLTPANSANFKIVQTTPFTGTNDDGEIEETTMDVEWAHATAPDANILLVTTPTEDDDDLQTGVLYVVKNHLANVISNSYGAGELSEDAQTAATWNQICEMAAAEGISANFASGDDGDFVIAEGATDVSLPASAPFATAVGGTSLGYSPFDGTVLQTGWGESEVLVGVAGAVLDPPQLQGFQAGSGGGFSRFFPAPGFQASLHLPSRGLPDIAALGDPLTGAEGIVTIKGVTYVVLEGGTSLSAPIFSGEWALLNQRFGYALGQAAPYIAQAAGTRALDDMVAPPEAALVTGSVTDSAGTNHYTADYLGQSATNTPFDTAWSTDGQGNVVIYSFGTDSSLALAPGWDTVTGWGTLDMGNIFTAVAGVK